MYSWRGYRGIGSEGGNETDRVDGLDWGSDSTRIVGSGDPQNFGVVGPDGRAELIRGDRQAWGGGTDSETDTPGVENTTQ